MKNLNKCTVALSILIALLVAGCDGQGQTPRELISAKKPLILLSTSAQGIVIVDAEGKIYTYDEDYYFAQNIIAGSLNAGDVLGN